MSQKITLTYYGVEGSGRTVTEAKRDAGRKIEAAFAGSYTPEMLAWRGYAILLYRSPEGWHKALVVDDGVPRESFGTGSAERDRERARREALMQLAQLGWSHDDGSDVPPFLTDRHEIAEFQSWAEFQRRMRAAKLAGLEYRDAFDYATRNPARDDYAALAARVDAHREQAAERAGAA